MTRHTHSIRALVRGLTWGLADQVLSSVTNFALGVLVARTVAPHEFGAFGLAYALYSIGLGAGRALVLEPLVVRFSAAPVSEWKSAVREAAGASLGVGLVLGAASLVVAAIAGGTLGSAFAVLSIAFPGLLLQDAWRHSFFALGRGARAFCNDLVWALVLFPGAALLLQSHHASMASIMWVWAAAGWTATLVGLAQARVVPRVGRAVAWVHGQRDLSFRYFGEFAVSSVGSQLSLFLIGALTTLTDVGHLRAGQTILGPLNILFLGTGTVAVAEAAKLLAVSPRKMDRALRLLTVALTGVTLAWAALAFLVPGAMGEAVLGPNWQGGRALLLPLAISTTGFALSYAAATGLRALAAAQSSLRARTLDATANLVLSAAGAVLAGASGAAWGYAVAGGIRVLNWWYHYARARSSISSAPPGGPLPDLEVG